MLLHTGGDSLTHLPHPDFTLDFAQQYPLFVCVRRLCSCDPMLISYSIHTYLILFACVSRICGTRMFLYYLSVIKYYLSLIINYLSVITNYLSVIKLKHKCLRKIKHMYQHSEALCCQSFMSCYRRLVIVALEEISVTPGNECGNMRE